MFGYQNIHQWRDEAKLMNNPLLSEWYKEACKVEKLSMVNGTGGLRTRTKLCNQFAWAVPCERAISEIAVYEPLVEIGAGTGYWASLLRSRGVDILAYDIAPPHLIENHYHVKLTYTEVLHGGPHAPHVLSALGGDRTLLLCWPPYLDSMACDSLRSYRGKHVIFVGEYQGCCADEQFFDMLSQSYDEVKTVEIPKFDCINDYLTVFRRHA
jgi:hypothetical protein